MEAAECSILEQCASRNEAEGLRLRAIGTKSP